MKVIEGIIQGTPEWLALRAKHNTASEAPAVMGASKYMSRSDLLKQKATGITPDVDSAKQALFNRGHAAEEGARAILEEIIGEDLYPVTAVCEKTNLLASLDGLTMDEKTAFECKLWGEGLAKQVIAEDLEPHYYWQLEQEILVTGAEKVIFVTSDGTRDKFVSMEYRAVPGRAEQLIAAWAQFDIDLANYVPPVIATPVVAQAFAGLPIVFDMRVEGKLVSCNIEQYKPAALAYISDINTELTTDQHFANADLDAKFCRNSAEKLKLAIEQALGQMGDINTAITSVREIAAAFDAKGLMLEKLVKSEKENRRNKIVGDAICEFAQHVSSLNKRLGKNYMPIIQADFSGVVKGLKSIDSMRDKVATELARAKIEANAIADRIQANLETKGLHGYAFLFADLATICLKPAEDFQNLVSSRIAAHEAAEAAKEEATRARIQAEEQAKAEKAAAAKIEAERMRNEQTKQAEIAEAARVAAESARIARIVTAPDVAEKAPEPEFTLATAPPSHQTVVVPFTPPVRPAPSSQPTLKLGDIAARLAPISITGAGLSQLGFEPAAINQNSRLYFEHEFPLICAALVKHINQIQAKQAA